MSGSGRRGDLHVAQINIGTLVAPVDDPAIAEFVDNLEPINALADRSPGFVWRLQTEEGDATSIHVFDDPCRLVNMSVWESVDALKAYVYRSEHVEFFSRRAEWFVPDASSVALWHVAAGAVPTVVDGVRRADFLRRHGRSSYAFGFGRTPEPLLIGPTTLDDSATAELIIRLNSELTDLYGDPDANHFHLDPAEVDGDRGAIVRADLGGAPVGCGAVRKVDDRTGELKRMYVDPAVRGSKVGAAVLDQLEQQAERLGLSEVVLETGIHQHAAIGLYESSGYEPAPLWGEYTASPETSRAYRKRLPAPTDR